MLLLPPAEAEPLQFLGAEWNCCGSFPPSLSGPPGILLLRGILTAVPFSPTHPRAGGFRPTGATLGRVLAMAVGHQGSPQVEILVQASTGRKLPFENLKFLPLMDPVTNPKPQPAAHTAGVTLRHNSSGQKGEIPTEAVIPWVPLMLKYKSGVRALH